MADPRAAALLRSVGFGEDIVKRFRNEEVDYHSLLVMNVDDFHTLGLKMGPALKLFKAVEKEKADTQGSAGNGDAGRPDAAAQPAAPNPPNRKGAPGGPTPRAGRVTMLAHRDLQLAWC